VVASAAGAARAQTVDEAAAPTPAPLAAIYACASETDDAARLNCYDAAVGRMRDAQSSGDVVAIDRQQATTLERQSFGFPLASLSALLPRRNGERDGIQSIEAQVERVVALADGRHTFILSNGQHWTQIEPRDTRNVRAGDTIEIRRAALGSFMLSPGRGAAHRVRRAY
jgi:hypothetical protein